MYIHYGFDIFIKCGGSEINITRINKQTKKFLYENVLINDRNDYNVNKQICIFWFQRVNWYDF